MGNEIEVQCNQEGCRWNDAGRCVRPILNLVTLRDDDSPVCQDMEEPKEGR